MPKCQTGVLIKCEKTIKIYILSLDKAREFLLRDLDEHTLMVRENYITYIQEEVYRMQDKNAYNPIEISNS
jgi:hypothetical protein